MIALWEARCPSNPMLSSTSPPVHSWISAGALAFSSPRLPNAGKDEPATSTTCSSSLNSTPLLSPLLLPGCSGSRVRKRRDLTTTTLTTTAIGVFDRRQDGLSCLRGGSDSDSVKEDSPAKNPGTKNDNGGNQQGQQQPAQEQMQAAGIAETERGGGEVFGGVALVTERSTATGGRRDRRCYSVLPDGTLQVGRAQQVSVVFSFSLYVKQ